MQAILLKGFGGIDQLDVGEISTPQPAPDEVQIRVSYAGVNPVDWKIRLGMLEKRMPHDFPIIPGWDAAGVVSKVGSDVTQFKVGDEVFAYCRKPVIKWGTYAEFVCFTAEHVAAKPQALSFAEAASLPVGALTAWQALFEAALLKPGETILIHAGAGGVGSFAIQFAKMTGAKVYTTASTAKHDYVKSLGADQAIDYKQGPFVQKIKKYEPQGVDVVFDLIGGDTLQQSFEALKPGGRLVSIVQPVDEDKAKQYGVKPLYVFVVPNGKQLQEIAYLIEQGKIQIPNIEEFPLKQAGEAQEKNREGKTTGKIVLKIG